MSYQQVFHGKVKGGQVVLINKDRYFRLCQALEGQQIVLTIGKHAKQRSDRQNRYYFGVVVKLISDYTGMEPMQVHEFLKDQFAPKEEISMPGADGKEIVKLVPISTAKLLTKQFSEDYVEKIRIWAASFLDVNIPDPSQVKV